ncbi:MAG TPA: 16S rRNA (guanine(966)-N(2))-methyltransferase RsmD [Microbacteriaceae bacterium]|nr:16S rRNA (guanine(966)-N(2))-methyltransferase RsmD [Microbacteriaceae bacterium]
MTRIVSGFAGSLALNVPRSGTRPTSDRVREAMFSSLDARDAVRGARVLDLYAGSGALGLEAASRGAASVVLVERQPAAAKVCKANVAVIAKAAPQNAAPRCDVVVSPVHSYLTHGFPAQGDEGGSFDLVFIDPPYDLQESELAAELAALVPLLAADATVVVERSTRSPEPTWPHELTPERSKTYGETVVWTARLS